MFRVVVVGGHTHSGKQALFLPFQMGRKLAWFESSPNLWLRDGSQSTSDESEKKAEELLATEVVDSGLATLSSFMDSSVLARFARGGNLWNFGR